MDTTKLNKWGDSQGILIPKKLCESAGLRIGDRVALSMDATTGTVEVRQKEGEASLVR